MEEEYEFNINYKFAHLLFKPEKQKDLESTQPVKVLVNKKDPLFKEIAKLSKQVMDKYDKPFFLYWEVRRSYTKEELETARLFSMRILYPFQPCGEMCGTLFDESNVCEICGSGRKQIGPLKLKNGTIPKMDIACSIAREVLVSDNFAAHFKERGLNGAHFDPIVFNKGSSPYQQLIVGKEMPLTEATIAGIDPFDLSEEEEGEVYKCPKGHTIGLSLLSQVHVQRIPDLDKYDLFISKQRIGVTRGVLRPQPLYLCSPAFRKMVLEEKLTGFDFEVAYVEG
jgi:hypothetical protein